MANDRLYRGPLVGVRMTKEFQSKIKAWAVKQSDKPTLASAIRRLVERGLLADTNSPDQRYQAKASESAGKAAKLAKELGLRTKAK